MKYLQYLMRTIAFSVMLVSSLCGIQAQVSAPEQGVLIVSTPEGAKVILDEKEVGVTPYLVDPITPGRHVINVILDGYEPQSQTFDAYSNKGKLFTFQLVKKPEPVVETVEEPAQTAAPVQETKTEPAKTEPAKPAKTEESKPAKVEKPAPAKETKADKPKPAQEPKADKPKKEEKTKAEEPKAKEQPKVEKPKQESNLVVNKPAKMSGVYFDFLFRSIDATAAGVGFGAYIHNFNLEASYQFGLEATDEIQWSTDITDQSCVLTYKPTIATGKLGYAIRCGSAFTITPQAGLSLMTTHATHVVDGDHNYDFGDKHHGLSWLVDLRLYLAFGKHFGIFATPMYSQRIAESKQFDSLVDANENFDKWANGFSLQMGFAISF